MVALNVVSIRSDSDIIAACMAARDAARRMGFSTTDQARIATATSELARNIVTYAGEGLVIINQVQHGQRRGIELIFEDQGPGGVDLSHVFSEAELAMPTTTTHMLPDTRRLVDDMQVETACNTGTRITCHKWLHSAYPTDFASWQTAT